MTTTPYKNFYLPVDRERGWGQKVRDNFTGIDSALLSSDNAAALTAANVSSLTTRTTRLEQFAAAHEIRLTNNDQTLSDILSRLAAIDAQTGGSAGAGTNATATVGFSVALGATAYDKVISASVGSYSPLTITAYQWAFGDGNIQTSGAGPYPNPLVATNHYANNGNFRVQLKVTFSDGSYRLAGYTVSVNAQTSVNFKAQLVSGINLGWRTTGLSRQFTQLSSDPYGTGVQLGLGYNENGDGLYTQRQGLVGFDLSGVPANATITSATLTGVLNSPQSFYYATSVRRVIGNQPPNSGVDASGNSYDYSYPAGWVLADAQSTLLTTLSPNGGGFSVGSLQAGLVPGVINRLAFAPDPSSIGSTTANLLYVKNLALSLTYPGSV